MTASIDFETRSGTDIKLGYCAYFGDSDYRPLCFQWNLGGITELWTPGSPKPQALCDHIASGGDVRGWNVIFEFHAWNKLAKSEGWPMLALEQCVDTMMQAAVANMPQGLGDCAIALGLPQDQQKNKRGKYLIQRLCKPHKPTLKRASVWIDDPALLAELYDYCRQDVSVEMAIAAALPEITQEHRDRWVLTQRINQRGLPIDVVEVGNIIDVVEQEKRHLNKTFFNITGISSPTKRADLLDWVRRRGVDAADLTSETVEKLLQSDLPDLPRQALTIRSQVCQTSTAKFGKMLDIVCADGTIKNLHAYHGASTGRYASRGGLNAQNLARPPLKDPETCVEVMGTGDWKFANLLYGGDVMDAAVSSIRGVIKAPPGKEFIDADFSSVENRVSAWIAGQMDKVADFAAGKDEYKTFACSMYEIDYGAVTKDQRQVAKSAVLGCFGEDTRVLTDSGVKRIIDITSRDLVYDGVEFVNHSGVVYQGVKPVIDVAGVLVTPDHLFLEGDSWVRADSINLQSVISTANGLLLAKQRTAMKRQQKCGVPVAVSMLSHFQHYDQADQQNVSTAITQDHQTQTGTDGSQDGLQLYPDAQTPRLKHGSIMVVGGFNFSRIGSWIKSCFLSTYALLMGGMTRPWNSTESTMTATMSPEILGLSPEVSSALTQGFPIRLSGLEKGTRLSHSGKNAALAMLHRPRSQGSFDRGFRQAELLKSNPSAEVPTFDILNAGPRSRFVVITDDGPAIAHNCMFGQGWKGLIDYATVYGVTLDEARSRELVGMYRDQYAKVKQLWYKCGTSAIAAIDNPGFDTKINDKLRIIFEDGYLKLTLPSGRKLYWYNPRVEMCETPWGDTQPCVTVMGVNQITRKFQRQKLIGSSIFQSSVQATAADLLINGVQNLELAGYSVVLLVHDEVLSVVDQGTRDEDEYGKLMCTTPEWASDLPLAYEAWRGNRFRK